MYTREQLLDMKDELLGMTDSNESASAPFSIGQCLTLIDMALIGAQDTLREAREMLEAWLLTADNGVPVDPDAPLAVATREALRAVPSEDGPA